MDQSHLDKMQKPGWSNGAAAVDPFKRNPDGTVPHESIVPVDPSHVAAAKAHGAAPDPNAEPDPAAAHHPSREK